MRITINMLVGSAHHKQLIKKIEYADKNGKQAIWNHDGKWMNVVDAYRCGGTNYLGVVLEC